VDPWALQHLTDTPALFLREINLPDGKAILTPMDEHGYRSSNFLDRRAARAQPEDAIATLNELARHILASPQPRRPIHFLFHIGHCGSTLISRLLGEFPGLLALREPPPLVLLSHILRHQGAPGMQVTIRQWQVLHTLVLTMLGRTFSPNQIALVKPPSHTNNLMASCLAWHPGTRGILLFVSLPAFLASVLRPDLSEETKGMIRNALWTDYCALKGIPPCAPPPLSEGECAALVWLVKMTEYASVYRNERNNERLMTVQFSNFLEDPRFWLFKLGEFLKQPITAVELDLILAGPIMRTNAKSPGQPFNRDCYESKLRVSSVTHADEIRRGQAWVERQAHESGIFSSAVEFVGHA